MKERPEQVSEMPARARGPPSPGRQRRGGASRPRLPPADPGAAGTSESSASLPVPVLSPKLGGLGLYMIS